LTIGFLSVILLPALDNNMTDKFTLDSDPRFVRNQLKEILVLIGETLDGAIPMVLASMQTQRLDFSPFAFSSLIRCHLKKALTQGGFNPQDSIELTPVALNRLSNDGVEFDEGSLRMKVLKGPSLPKATSWSRGVFYSQQSVFDFGSSNNSENTLRSLVVLWDYDASLGQLNMLLVAPKNRDGEILWQLPIPLPPEWMSVRDTLDTDDEDLDIDFVEEEGAKGA
jgi:hypothetical protein